MAFTSMLQGNHNYASDVKQIYSMPSNNGYMRGNRIRALRTARKLTQQQVADYCGVSRVAVAKWESGDTENLKPPHLFKLARLLGVSPEEIALGTGSVRQTDATPIEPGEEFVPIARVRLKLQAGVTGFAIEQAEGNGPPIFFRRDFLNAKGWRPDRLLALKVAGDSMEPALYDGDLVVVNTAETEPKDGEVFAVNYEGETVIKRLRRDAGQWWLDSDNPRYRSKLCDEHAVLIGRVVYKQSEHI